MRRFGVLLVVILIVGGVLLGYALPRITGDRFASALIRFDLTEAKNTLCPDTSLGQITSLLGGDNALALWLSQQLGTGIQVPGWSEIVKHIRLESAYSPLSGVYTVSYVIDQTVAIGGFELRGGLKTPPLTLGVRRLSPLSLCLTMM